MVEGMIYNEKNKTKDNRAQYGKTRLVFNKWKYGIMTGFVGLTLMGSAAALQECTKQSVVQTQKEQHRLNDKLLYAALDGKTEKVKELVKKGADVNAKYEGKEHELPLGITPLLSAVSLYANPEIVKSLVETGADVNAKDEFGRSALILAADYSSQRCHKMTASEKRDHAEIIKLLIDKKADVNAQSRVTGTPLACAAFCSDPEVAELLLNAGADIEARDNITSMTPLMNAAYSGNAKMVEFLLTRGAAIDAKDHHGKTALMLAEERLQELTTRLEKAEAGSYRDYFQSWISGCRAAVEVLEKYKAES